MGLPIRGYLLCALRGEVSLYHVGRQRWVSDSSLLTLHIFSDVGGPADPIAPTIIIPPKNTSVVAGTSEVTMECVANAR